MAILFLRPQIRLPRPSHSRRSGFIARHTTRSTAISLLLLCTLHGGAATGQELRSNALDAALAATNDTGDFPITRMQFPVTPPEQVTRTFDRPDRDWSAGHRGVDFAAHPDGPVLAPAAGEVTYVGKVVDRGVLVLQHDGGLRSSFEPIDSTLSPGQHVSAGAVVGHIATEDEGLGHCGPNCLHWGVRVDDFYLDPLLLVQGAPSVLLPEHS